MFKESQKINSLERNNRLRRGSFIPGTFCHPTSCPPSSPPLRSALNNSQCHSYFFQFISLQCIERITITLCLRALSSRFKIFYVYMYVVTESGILNFLHDISQILCVECGFMSSEIESRIRSTNHNQSALLLHSKFHNRRNRN